MGAAGGPGSSKKDFELKQGESKKAAEAGMGASGPGAEDEEASELFQGKSDEDANLVDPDADRPDFGAKALVVLPMMTMPRWASPREAQYPPRQKKLLNKRQNEPNAKKVNR